MHNQAFPHTCYEVPCLIQQQAHIFPSLPFPADKPVEDFLVALRILLQIQLQQGFGFPNSVAAHSESLYSPGSPDPASTFCCFLFFFWSSLFIHAGLLSPLLDFLYRDGPFLSLEEKMLENQLALLDTSSFQ